MEKPVNRLFDGVWFGPVGHSPDGVDERVVEIADRCKLGDFSRRRELVDILLERPPRNVALDAQRLLLATATDAQLRADALSYIPGADDEVVLEMIESGIDMLCVAAVPVMLSAHEEAIDAREIRALAIHSIEVILGIELSEFVDAPTAELAAEIEPIVSAMEDPYRLAGEPADPRKVIDVLKSRTIESFRSESPMSNEVEARVLSTWSGIAVPLIVDDVPDYEFRTDVFSFAGEAARLSWVPGRKYFYGHDVEGGPALESAVTSIPTGTPADGRGLRLIDRLGGENNGEDVTVDAFAREFDTLHGEDPEHDEVSLGDAEDWVLGFRRDSVRFENIGEDEIVIGTMSIESRDHALEIARDFIEGDLSALRARDWRTE